MLAAVAALLLVPAASAFAAEEVHITISGNGSGEVTSGNELGEFEGEPTLACSYNGATQSGVCNSKFVNKGFPEEKSYAEFGFQAIESNAVAKPGSKFLGWTSEEEFTIGGCGTGEKEGCLVGALTGEGEDRFVTAKFALNNLALNIEEGSGTVVSSPAGLICSGTAPKTCEGVLPAGKVTLTASPAPGYLFKSWKGCETGGVNGRQCTVTTAEALKTVGVKFVKAFSLKGSKTGGSGIMGTAPGGIVCGYVCSSSTALYKEGSLTVKAKPAKHFEFVEFKGGTGSATSCNGSKALECTIASFTSNSTIEEVYAEEKKNTLSVTKEGGGQGFVKTTPSNINCGYTCTAAAAQFYASESAAITVTLNKGTTSVTWTTSAGTCTGKVLTCSVPMSSSKTLVAKFE